jgi:cytochrome c553
VERAPQDANAREVFMKKLVALAGAIPLFAASSVSLADAAGKAKWDAACADCHEVSEYAGKPAADMTKTLKGMVGGTIKHKPTLKLTDAEIASLAAFLASAK